jgi:hypothetical protein
LPLLGAARDHIADRPLHEISAAHRSAWPVAVVVTAPTISPLRFSIRAWPIKHSRASLPNPPAFAGAGFLRNKRVSGSVVETCVSLRRGSP